MTDTMLAAVLEKFQKPLVIKSVPVPQPKAGEVLIRLSHSGVCHSDVHVWQGDMRPTDQPHPFILGHEGVGVVMKLGADVSTWKVGDRVGVGWLHSTCGTCAECADHDETFCQTQIAHGFNVPGSFAEYMIADADYAFHLPDGDGAALAPLMCAGLTAYGALQRAELKSGETCAVFGCGGLGQYAIQLAKRRGARVIAVDIDPIKLKLARQNGADVICLPQEITAQSAEVCINFAPTTATWAAMVKAVRPRGRIVAAAMVSEPVPLSQEWLASVGVKVMGTSVGTRVQMQELLGLHSDRPLQGAVEIVQLQNVNEALEKLRNGKATGRYCIAF